MDSFKEYDLGISRLDEIIEKLESDDLTLEENIKLYEEGIKLHKKLKQILKSQEGKILMIQQEEEIEFEQISIIGESENEL
ncbi:exodeoxyribonuclease VII small subunit [Gallicola sp. Sow4_E12]|uniref:exodeoxyribonuclease VII small subunit n=1 Tax=Gallicola sp. Sow4_E12 TaxID=3438785 RepID=UPI003F9063FC